MQIHAWMFIQHMTAKVSLQAGCGGWRGPFYTAVPVLSCRFCGMHHVRHSYAKTTRYET